MLPCLRCFVVVPTLLIACCWYSSSLSAASPLIIDDENLSFDILYLATIYGFRSFPISNIISHNWKDGLVIKASILADSLNAVAPGRSVTLQELQGSRTITAMTQGYTPVLIGTNYDERQDLAIPKLAAPSSGEYDARFIVSAFGTELVDQESLKQAQTVDGMEVIRLNSKVAMDLLTAYAGLNSLQSYQTSKIPTSFTQLDNALAQHSELYAVAKIPIGKLEMGKPLIFDPSELGIKVPAEWRDAYNVKLILFAITVREYLKGVETIDVSITLPENCIALDLVPLSYIGDTVSSETTETRNLVIRTILGGDIEYQRRLKPVIQAYGLQSNEFGWQLRGEALGFGSTRVAALLRAPKELDRFGMQSAFILRGPDSWVTEGSVGSSEPEVYEIAF